MPWEHVHILEYGYMVKEGGYMTPDILATVGSTLFKPKVKSNTPKLRS